MLSDSSVREKITEANTISVCATVIARCPKARQKWSKLAKVSRFPHLSDPNYVVRRGQLGDIH